MFKKLWWMLKVDRLGPEVPLTHWMLHLPILMRWLCKKKFKRFGTNSEFRPGSYADNCKYISIGSNVIIHPQSMLFSENGETTPDIIIDDDVLLGSGIHMYIPYHEYSDPEKKICDQGYRYKGNIKICQGAWVGANSIILSGVTIGEHSVIGAGSIVTRDIPPFVVAAGNPAKVIRAIK